jgi:hypothetical protein
MCPVEKISAAQFSLRYQTKALCEKLLVSAALKYNDSDVLLSCSHRIAIEDL